MTQLIQSACRSPPCCRRRCRGSARRAQARPHRGAAAEQGRPSAGCRRTVRDTRCAGPAVLMPSRSIHVRAAARCRAGETRIPGPSPSRLRQRHVVGDAQRGRKTFAGPVLAEHPHAVVPRLCGPGWSAVHPQLHRPAPHGIKAEEPAKQARPAGAQKARNAEDLPPMEREGRRAEPSRRQAHSPRAQARRPVASAADTGLPRSRPTIKLTM